jgi:hypothetical protein
MKPTQVRAQVDYALATLDGLADKWAEDVNLTSMIKHATSPMDLVSHVPADVRTRFRLRMEALIDEIVRQAFREGVYRAITGLQDEREAMEAAGIDVEEVRRAADDIGKDAA